MSCSGCRLRAKGKTCSYQWLLTSTSPVQSTESLTSTLWIPEQLGDVDAVLRVLCIQKSGGQSILARKFLFAGTGPCDFPDDGPVRVGADGNAYDT